jgi:hypothetical protein
VDPARIVFPRRVPAARDQGRLDLLERPQRLAVLGVHVPLEPEVRHLPEVSAIRQVSS